MTQLVEPLAWDSEFFGFRIGRADLDGASEQTMQAMEAEGRALDLTCLYTSLDPEQLDTAYLAQRYGHRLVEVAITFERPAVPYAVKPTKSTVRAGSVDDLPSLGAAVATLAPWSRFATDPRFGPVAAERMFHAWVERAARDDDRLLLIAEDDDGISGLSTQNRSDPPRVDLMGVITPGSGASWALMQGFVEWAGDVPIHAGPCAARNVAVLRFLEHGGFRIASTRYLFHRWFDEATGITS